MEQYLSFPEVLLEDASVSGLAESVIYGIEGTCVTKDGQFTLLADWQFRDKRVRHRRRHSSHNIQLIGSKRGDISVSIIEP
jgi:hypothetical protein